ncbi:MAG: hypothetical protein ACRDBO_19445 [Lachnospiraceae bacterium]
MKKLFILMLSIIAMTQVACGGSKKDERTISTFANAFVEQSVDVNLEEKPFFQMVGAKDGVIFYMDDKKVAIYEYEDAKALGAAQKEYSGTVQGWPANGKFLMESSNEKAKEIFDGVKQ